MLAKVVIRVIRKIRDPDWIFLILMDSVVFKRC